MRWLVWAILAPVLYVFGMGPMAWLVIKHHLPEEAFVIYKPLFYLPQGLQDVFINYLHCWTP